MSLEDAHAAMYCILLLHQIILNQWNLHSGPMSPDHSMKRGWIGVCNLLPTKQGVLIL